MEEGATVLGEYFYDAFGRRVKKIASGVTTLYHYDVAGNLIAETTAGGTPLRDIVYMNGERVAMKLYGSQAGWYFFVNDHLGTPQKIADASGNVVWAGFYLPFGKAWAYPATIVNNFRFPGQYYDAEMGLHYNWNRYYDPDTGRYVTADPIGLEGGVNLYEYALNNPVNYGDVSGLNPLAFAIMRCLSSPSCSAALATGIAATAAGVEATITSLMGKGKKKGKNPCKDESTPGMPPNDEDPEDPEIRNTYNSIKDSPNYPKNFTPDKNNTLVKNVNNRKLLETLRKIEPGKWQKVYKNGWVNGERVSIHYFRSESGKVFNVKTLSGWSQNIKW